MKIASVFCLLMLLAAVSCSFTPEKKEIKPRYDVPEKYQTESFDVERDAISASYWWKTFNDEALNKLVEKVLKHNLDLKMAASRVKMIETQFDITHGLQYPAASLSAGYTRARAPVPETDVNFSATPPDISMGYKSQTSNQYSLKTGLRFEIDIWGKLRSMEKSVLAELMASKADLQTAYLGIIARTVMLYYDIEADLKIILLLEESIAANEEILNLQRRRYEKGVGAKENIEVAENIIEASKIELENYRQFLKGKEHNLAFLQGEYPSEKEMSERARGGILPKLEKIDTGVPSSLLRNRSDIVSASFRLDSAREMIGAAKADLFPNVALTAGLGYSVTSLDDLFTSKFLAGSVGIDASQTLFSGGSKTAAHEQKKVQYEQAELNYRKTVLNAFKEVEDALIQLKSLSRNLKSIEKTAESTEQTLMENETRYQKGILPYPLLLQSKIKRLTTLKNLILTQKALLFARINLHRALGGNWVLKGEDTSSM